MAMNEEEIARCPFCRDMNTELIHDPEYAPNANDLEIEFKNGAWYVICTVCRAQGPACGDTPDYKGKSLALNLWNNAKR